MIKTLKNVVDPQVKYQQLKLIRRLKKKVKMVNQLPKEVEEDQRRVKRKSK